MTNDILTNYILNQNDPQACLKLAYWYIEDSNNYSAAITYFLKAAELDNCPINIKYECLMMISQLYQLEGCRWAGAKQYATFAKSEMPMRPEAYLLLCEIISGQLIYTQIQEQGDWLFVYENAKIGLNLTDKHDEPISFFYKGKEYLKLYYALSLLKLNKHNELKEFLKDYKFINATEDDIINNIIYIYNEIKLDCPYINYYKKNFDKLKIKFKNSNKIKQNHAQSMQDMFVLTMLDGKSNGTYFELGAKDPIYQSNTKLLEEFGWKGISIGLNDKYLNKFLNTRKNHLIIQNNYNYNDILNNVFDDSTIDYLSINIDPVTETLKYLYKIPFNEYKFNIITIKHDKYIMGSVISDTIKNVLTDYVLIKKDIMYNGIHSYEDWYIHKSLYTQDVKQKLKLLFNDDSTNIMLDSFLNK